MKFLIFDTETGGINPDKNDILQLSYQVVDLYKGICCGLSFVTSKEANYFFPWPEDKSRVQKEAIKVNGLTEEYLATKKLSDRSTALEEFFADMSMCDYVVAHNGEFDRSFIIHTAVNELLRTGKAISGMCWKPMIDTMMTTINLCKLPPRPGKTDYKWPKLIELAECLQIKTDDINLHDSSADVELTKRCFIYLVEKEFYNNL